MSDADWHKVDAVNDALILVVDDNEANLALFRGVLEEAEGVRVVCLSDARAVESVFLADWPDLVILDLHMPYLSGMDLLGQLGRHVPVTEFLPFLVVTADSSSATRNQALGLGATDFITKPIDVIETRLRVARLLETRRLHRAVEAERLRLDDAVVERTAELQAANADLLRLVDSKDQFLAAVSHELRTPLAAILGFSSELSANAASMSSVELAEFTAIIAEQTADVASIIDDLTVAARSSIGRVSVLTHPVDVFEELTKVVDVLPADARDRIEVVVMDAVVAGDPLRIRQILRNLIRNAVVHGGERITVELDSMTGGWAVIRVLDDGDGVPPHERNAMFDTPLDTSNKQARPGSMGLGLFVSRDLARLMGGDICYRDGQPGAVFELRLPSMGVSQPAGGRRAWSSETATR